MCTTPTAAIEAVLGLCPLNIKVGETAKKAYTDYLQVDRWNAIEKNHRIFGQQIANYPLLGMLPDESIQNLNLSKTFRMVIPTRQGGDKKGPW